MSWMARVVYGTLVWRERRLARRERRRGLRQFAPETPEAGQEAAHLETGRRGEVLAYWYLRQAGYTVVARNRRPDVQPEHQPGPAAGELDLVGWDGPVLAFVEVKTRSRFEPESGLRLVGDAQRQRIVQSARSYVRRLQRTEQITYRFDVMLVSWDAMAGYSVRLVKDAFRPKGQG